MQMRAKGACVCWWIRQDFIDFNEILGIFKDKILSDSAKPIIMLYFVVVLYLMYGCIPYCGC